MLQNLEHWSEKTLAVRLVRMVVRLVFSVARYSSTGLRNNFRPYCCEGCREQGQAKGHGVSDFPSDKVIVGPRPRQAAQSEANQICEFLQDLRALGWRSVVRPYFCDGKDNIKSAAPPQSFLRLEKIIFGPVPCQVAHSGVNTCLYQGLVHTFHMPAKQSAFFLLHAVENVAFICLDRNLVKPEKNGRA